MNQTLVVTERMSNEELQDARKELINVRTKSYNFDSALVTLSFVLLILTLPSPNTHISNAYLNSRV